MLIIAHSWIFYVDNFDSVLENAFLRIAKFYRKQDEMGDCHTTNTAACILQLGLEMLFLHLGSQGAYILPPKVSFNMFNHLK